MSYAVYFKGFFRFKKDITKRELDDCLGDILDVYYDPSYYDVSRDANSIVVEINGYVNYSEDEVFSLLKRLNLHLLDAEIEYVGEDHAHWRHKKYDKRSCFVEESGTVVYNDEQYDLKIE